MEDRSTLEDVIVAQSILNHHDGVPETDLPTTAGDSVLVQSNTTDELPCTVKVLHFPIPPEGAEVVDGDPRYGKVYLVGTAHFSLESQADVISVIRRIQPDVVMVELCSNRFSFLTLDEKTILKEARELTFEKIMATIKHSGVLQGVLHVLLLSMSAHITRELGMAPGGEFRVAYQEAQRIHGCKIHLGDRPIQITLHRALASLTLWQKVRLAWYILTSKQKITKEDVERCKQSDLLEEMLREMAGEFPGLSRIFVNERDLYMSYGLKRLVQSIQEHKTAHHRRSDDERPVDPTVIVGVVGIGHLPGIVSNWQNDDVDFASLLEVPVPSTASRFAKKFIKGAVLGLGCYLLYRASHKVFCFLQRI